MTATEIGRISTTDLEHPKSERASLAMEAKDKLGYTRLANRLITKSPLMETLVELDILPLRRHQVEKYKKSKEKNSMYGGHKVAIYAVFLFTLCIPAFSKVLVMSVAMKGWTFGYAMSIVGIIAICAIGIVSLIVTAMGFDDSNKGTRTIWRWVQTSMESKSCRFVPDRVIIKALQIRKAYPDAVFYVETLEPDQETIRNMDGNWLERQFLDPFLVVKNYAGEEYYVDVWDEKDYKNEM
jgi:hypothetical protein